MSWIGYVLIMWIDDIFKALAYLDTTEYKYSVCIEKIENGYIYFSNHKKISLHSLMAHEAVNFQ